MVDTVGCAAIHNLQLKSIFWERRTIAHYAQVFRNRVFLRKYAL